MKVKIIKKLLTTLLIISISINVFLINVVNATIQENNTSALNNSLETQDQASLDLDKVLETEEKIMMYDVKTNETTEVDMEQLKQELSTKIDSRERASKDSFGTEPYTPPAYISKNVQNKAVRRRGEPYVTLDIVNDTSYQPYVNVCRITQMSYVGGTCALVGPHIGITAAHCVFDKENNNEFYRNWTIYPGYNGEDKGYATSCGFDKVYYSSKYLETYDFNYDWAICILQADVGNQVGYFGTRGYYDTSVMKDMEIRIYGYPGSNNGTYEPRSIYQYTAWGMINEVPKRIGANDIFGYYSITHPGMSGGPIVPLNEVNTIIGIIVGYDHDNHKEGVGVRMTENMVNIIRNNM